MNTVSIITRKRDGYELSRDEIKYIVDGYTSGSVPDYQMSAFLMAVYFRGMNKRETVDLTDIMRVSGDIVDLSGIRGVKVDKHSTGGVGDKTTLIVGPVAAACGVPGGENERKRTWVHGRHCGQTRVDTRLQDFHRT